LSSNAFDAIEETCLSRGESAAGPAHRRRWMCWDNPNGSPPNARRLERGAKEGQVGSRQVHGYCRACRTFRRSIGRLPQQRLGSPQLSPKVAVHSGACGCAILPSIAGREGLIGVRQRQCQALTWGWREQKNDRVESRAYRRHRVNSPLTLRP
jgi:hypothetical protein